MENERQIKHFKKKREPTVKMIKYHKAVMSGKGKFEALKIAGYSHGVKPRDVENKAGYQVLSIKDSILAGITMEEITMAHVENIRQVEDKGARNNAIKLAYERIEPDNKAIEQEERVFVILKETNNNTTTNNIIRVEDSK